MKPKLLIVDDNSMLRETTRSILELKFPLLRIFEAGDGKEALNIIHDHSPDLVLMDIRLPDENGLKLTRKIKAKYPKIVIAIFTNHDLPEYRKAAFDNGAEFFLSKLSREGGRLTTVVESVLAEV
jgi:DNA-binding NarL/FixJ family response regulator